MTKSSHCFWKHNRNSGHRFCINGLPRCWVDYYFFTPTIRSWQWSQRIVVMAGRLCYSVMKVMVWQFMSNSHEVMTVPIGYVTFELLLWRFICSSIDMVLCSRHLHTPLLWIKTIVKHWRNLQLWDCFQSISYMWLFLLQRFQSFLLLVLSVTYVILVQ
jgi:hypothetical protein